MYCAFYGIQEKPFSITPDPKFLYLGKTHKEAFAHLLYGIRERGGFIVVTGEIGAGKTTLCRGLLSHLDEDTLVAFIFNPTLSALELLKGINEDFGIASRATTKKELIDELNQFLLDKRKQGKNTVLIIDEAQGLDGEVLEQIRLLSNLETETEKLLQIILIGQPEFRHILEQPRLLQLNQRVTVRYHLGALSEEETAEYIHHRLSVIGGEDKVFFSPEALKKIWRTTRGVPRLINVICDRALLAGYSLKRRHIDGKMIDQARKEVSGGPAWGRHLRFVRLVRLSFVPASLVLAFVILLAFGLRAYLREAGTGNGDRPVRVQVASSEKGPVQPQTEPVLATSPSDTESTQTAGAPFDALASEPDRPEDEDFLARVSSTRDATESPLESASHEDLERKEPESAETEGVDEHPVEPALSASGDQGLSEDASHYEATDAREGRDAIEREFLRAIHTKSLLQTREEAFLAVVQQWDRVAAGDEQKKLYRDAPDLYKAAKAFGFQCLRFRGNINRVRALNLPALMELRLGEALTKRYVALLAIDGTNVEITPALPTGSSLLPLDVLESYWYGTAYVLWKDVWGGRTYLAKGMKGDAVKQLQASLKDLGYYERKPSGLFDRKTADAVRAFQKDHFLDEDGILGPQTRIVLYQTLQRFQMPVLEEAEGHTG
jgi:general secretion pathway protein A